MRTTQGGGGGAFVIFTEKENVQQLRSVCNPGTSEARSCSDLGGEGVQEFVACTAMSV